MKAISTIFIICVFMPVIVLMFKLTKYLIQTEFREWWITIIWALLFPVSMVIVSENIKGKLTRKGDEENEI